MFAVAGSATQRPPPPDGRLLLEFLATLKNHYIGHQHLFRLPLGGTPINADCLCTFSFQVWLVQLYSAQLLLILIRKKVLS